MRKSDITRTPATGRFRCQWSGRDEIRCTEKSAETVTVTSYPTGSDPVTGDCLLCAKHADAHVSAYENEWARHPEMFE